MIFLIIFGFFAFSAISEVAAQEGQVLVRGVEVKDNKKIDQYAILAKIKTEEGKPLSQDQLREDLKAVYQMGFFEDVMISTEEVQGGLRVVFTVVEKPFLIDIKFNGNQEIEEDTLKEKITLKTQVFVDRQQVKEDAEKLREYYEREGYFETRVIPFLKSIDEDKVTLTLIIREGTQARIRSIRFEGARAVSTRELKKEIETRQYFWLTSWLTSSGIYKEEIIDQDVERIKERYLDRGYLQVQVGDPRAVLSEDKQWFDIIFPIIEGDQFRVRAIEFTGTRVFTEDELSTFLSLKEGEILRRDVLRADVRTVTDKYGETGYLFTQVLPRLNPDPENLTVDVILEVHEEGPVTVRQINIGGNNKTRDKVIRREIRVDEQEIINTNALRRSFQRINNLNFFEAVEIVPQEIRRDVVDLDVRVKEKPTGTFSVGGGYSSVDKLVALIEITQGNLFGRGQLLRGRLETGGRRTTYSLTFREPYVLDYAVAGTLDFFDQERDFDSYKEDRRGGGLTFSKEFNEYVQGSLGYRVENLRIFETTRNALGSCIAATIICAEESRGRTSTRSASISVGRDTRDFFFDPKKGARNAVTYEHAGTFLTGTNDFYKVNYDSSRYFSLWLDTVVKLHGRIGYLQGMGGKEVPQGERFFVGGINSVRGFDFGRAGPVDLATGDVIGGNKVLIFNAEYIFPIVQEAKIKGVVFFDAGRGFDNGERIGSFGLRTAAGFGIRLLLPIGPIRLEWGKNLNPRPGEKSGFLPEFSIGTLF